MPSAPGWALWRASPSLPVSTPSTIMSAATSEFCVISSAIHDVKTTAWMCISRFGQRNFRRESVLAVALTPPLKQTLVVNVRDLTTNASQTD